MLHHVLPVFPEAPTMQTFIARTSGSPKRLSRTHPNDDAHYERTSGRPSALCLLLGSC